jgi:Tfp pilus assembly pilus retraction ATPase PilT
MGFNSGLKGLSTIVKQVLLRSFSCSFTQFTHTRLPFFSERLMQACMRILPVQIPKKTELSMPSLVSLGECRVGT